jgi:hypothetical protein
MYDVFSSTVLTQSLTASAMNSGQLSDLIEAGTPSRMNRSLRVTLLRNALTGNGQRVDDFDRIQLPFQPDRQAFLAGFIQNVKRPKGLAIVCVVLHEFIEPDMVCDTRDVAGDTTHN